jgi:hypothetical protein
MSGCWFIEEIVYLHGLQVSLVIAAVLLIATAAASLLLRPARHGAGA